jgi:hypothetical protein
MTASGALTEEQISLPSRNFSPSRALVRIAAEVPAASVLVDTSGECGGWNAACSASQEGSEKAQDQTIRDETRRLRAVRRAQWAAVLRVAAMSSMARWLGASRVCCGCVGKHLYIVRPHRRCNTRDGLHSSSAECAFCRTHAHVDVSLCSARPIHAVLKTSLSSCTLARSLRRL